MIECLVNVIHMPPGPFIAFATTTTTPLGDIEYDIPLDSYILLRIFQNHTQYTNGQAFRICQINGFVPDSWFAIKCMMSTNPMFFLAIGSAGTIILFGLICLKFER